jgi:hypothetical protein
MFRPIFEGRVYKYGGEWVVVMFAVGRLAYVRYEEDRTNRIYPVPRDELT